MIANIICVTLIAGYAAFNVWYLIHEYLKSKKEGIPQGCLGCNTLKQGKCSGHGCTLGSHSQDFLEKKHKEFLEKQKNK